MSGRRIKAMWRWSWVVTLPIAIAYSLWVIDTWRTWRHFAIDYAGGEQAPSLHDVGRDRFNHMARAATLPFTSKLSAIAPELQLPSIQLFIKGRDLGKLDSNPPYSGFEFVTGRLVYGDGQKTIKVRYRGDSLVHWAHDKKSLRIKTGAREHFAGMRAFNLVAPKSDSQLANYLSYRLAQELGLLAPRCELVSVFINGRYEGLHQLTEQLDEGTLRRHGRMPGDLYTGDFVGEDRIAGARNHVFESPQRWGKVAANATYGAESRAPLEALLAVLNQPITATGQDELTELLDMNAWGSFGAFLLLTQTTQYDEHENWRLYWDPWRRHFEPVVWDPMGWPEQTEPIADFLPSRLLLWLGQNAEFLAARHRALARFFGDGAVDRFEETIQWSLAAAREAVRRDPNIRPTEPDRIEAAMQRLVGSCEHTLEQVRARYVDAPPQVRWAVNDDNLIFLAVSGLVPLTEAVFRFERPLSDGVRVSLLDSRPVVMSHSGNDVSHAATVRGDHLHVALSMSGNNLPHLTSSSEPGHRRRLQTRPAIYVVAVDSGRDNRVVDVRGATAVAAEALFEFDPGLAVHASIPVRPQPRTLTGTVQFDGIQEFGEDVVIEPGTTIRLTAGASLLFRGRVHAVGTEERPIRFLPVSDGELPWGTIALDHRACTGSRFGWCEFRGGSGYKAALAEYSSMFAIHDCADIRLEHCSFADNHQFDDMIHVVYAECVLDDIRIEGALSDAIDCDISRVVIRNSTIQGSGNDAIDLMTTDAVIHDCYFHGSGSAGITITEGSRVLAVRTRFRACDQAIEIEDGSVARFANSDLSGCKTAASARKTNWRFDGGGQLTLDKSVVLDCTVGPTADKWSRTALADCRVVDDLPPQDAPLLIDCDEGENPRNVAPLPFPDELADLVDLAAAVWATVRTDRRGAADGN